MDELKPCPFCEGEAVHSRQDKPLEGLKPWMWHFITCAGCTHQVAKICAPDDPSIIINFWNRRRVEDALRAEVERLKDENEGINEKWFHQYIDAMLTLGEALGYPTFDDGKTIDTGEKSLIDLAVEAKEAIAHKDAVIAAYGEHVAELEYIIRMQNNAAIRLGKLGSNMAKATATRAALDALLKEGEEDS